MDKLIELAYQKLSVSSYCFASFFHWSLRAVKLYHMYSVNLDYCLLFMEKSNFEMEADFICDKTEDKDNL